MKRRKVDVATVIKAINAALKGDISCVTFLKSVYGRLSVEELEAVRQQLVATKFILRDDYIALLKMKNNIQKRMRMIDEMEKKVIYQLGKKKSMRCVYFKKLNNHECKCKMFPKGTTIIRLRRYYCPYCKFAFMSREEATLEEL